MKIKEIGTTITGKTPSTSNPSFFDGLIPFVTPEDLSKKYIITNTKRFLSESGYKSIKNNTLENISVLVGCIGSDMGNIGITLGRCATNQQINAITNFVSNVDPYYIYYYLSMHKAYLRQIAGMTTTPILPKSVFDEIDIPIPSYEKQNKIVAVLKKLDDKILLNNSIISKLEEMAKTIYGYWFLQFDFPNHEGKPYASSGGAMKYSEELGREIPTDWEVENFYQNSLFSLVPTGVEKFSTKRYLATADVIGTNIGEGKQVEYETRETRANMQPRINSVWFAKMKNSTKHLFLNKEMGFLIEKCILSTGFFGLQCSETSFEYIASTISYPSFEIKKDSLAHGATQEAVNQDDLQSIKLLVPNILVLEKFHKLTKPLYGYISQMRHENQKLAQLRDWLLPMLMNGQVRVE